MIACVQINQKEDNTVMKELVDRDDKRVVVAIMASVGGMVGVVAGLFVIICLTTVPKDMVRIAVVMALGFPAWCCVFCLALTEIPWKQAVAILVFYSISALVTVETRQYNEIIIPMMIGASLAYGVILYRFTPQTVESADISTNNPS